jgi:hypothetical protein
MHDKHGFRFCPDHMNMGGAVIVGPDHDPQTVDTKHGGHKTI